MSPATNFDQNVSRLRFRSLKSNLGRKIETWDIKVEIRPYFESCLLRSKLLYDVEKLKMGCTGHKFYI